MTIFGSSAYGGSVTEWTRIDNKLRSMNGNYGMQARRSYASSVPSSFENSGAFADYHKRISALSIAVDPGQMAAGDFDNKLRTYVNDVPSDHTIYLGYFHEPEDNMTPGAFGAAWARFAQVVLNEGNTNIIPSGCLMAYTFQAGSGRDEHAWVPGELLSGAERDACLFGVDGYAREVPAQRTPNWLFDYPWQVIRDEGFDRVGVFECGVNQESPRTAWMLNLETHAASRDVELICWWHSHNFAEGRWFYIELDGAYTTLADPGSTQTWADIISRNQDDGAPVVVVDPGDLPDPTDPPPTGGGGTPVPVQPGPQFLGGEFAPAEPVWLASANDTRGFVHRGRMYTPDPGVASANPLYPDDTFASYRLTTTNETSPNLTQDWWLEEPGTTYPFGITSYGDRIDYGFDCTDYIDQYNNFYGYWGDESLWVIRLGISNSMFADYYAINPVDGSLIAHYVSDVDAIDHEIAQMIPVAADKCLLVRNFFVDDTLHFDLLEVSGSTMTVTRDVSIIDVDSYETLSGSLTNNFYSVYHQDSGWGATRFINDSEGHFCWLTWHWDGSSATAGQVCDHTAALQVASGSSGLWWPDYYLYGNPQVIGSRVVDIAADIDALGTSSFQGPDTFMFHEFYFDTDGLHVTNTKTLPEGAVGPNWRDHLTATTIGWGSGVHRALDITEMDGTYVACFDFGFVTGGGAVREDFGLSFVRDIFGAQTLDVLNTFDAIHTSDPNIVVPDLPDNEWYITNWNAGSINLDQAVQGSDLYLTIWLVFSYGVPDDSLEVSLERNGWVVDANTWSAAVRLSFGGETPNLAGEFEDRKRVFPRGPTNYTP